MQVILECPAVAKQLITSWQWREPKRELDSQVPSLIVSHKAEGRHSSGLVELGPKLRWARIVDRRSQNSPKKLWCNYEFTPHMSGRVSFSYSDNFTRTQLSSAKFTK
ncbi:unnamed protein product [Protopolystoma xenopodis]|uniref:Uncharacterized protein n=1 Tax=Protopolystoma xenopodis TaxID=117903 RepID=A0A3S5B654_9PLAT|nr:unnamed protein product [Protopolystoma xenopodis]